MNRMIALGVAGLFAGTLVGCASMGKGPSAEAMLQAKSGSSVSGVVRFQETAAGVQVMAKVSGLTPGEHGFHVHEVGDCSAADGTSAKGHFNPMAKMHGHLDGEHHVGDMPNLKAGPNGEANLDATLAGVTLGGPNGVGGRAVVIHADPDDYKSQPAGNSGKRVACGVITMAGQSSGY